jgi:hypothetical protein
LDVTLTEGAALVRPSTLQPSGGWAALAAGTQSTEVLRRGVSVRSPQLVSDSVTILGIDPAGVHGLRSWRADFGPSPATLASAITAPPPPTLGTPIPEHAERLVLHGGGDLRTTEVRAIVARRDGTWHQVKMVYDAAAPDQLVAELDPTDGGGRLIGFRMGQPGTDSAKIEHHLGEGFTSAAYFTATVNFDRVEADDGSGTPAALAVDWSALTSDGAVVTRTANGVSVDLRLQGSAALVLPRTPEQLGRLAAIVDPATAAAAQNGSLVIDVPGPTRLTLRVAAVAHRFPGAPDRFIIVDRAQLRLAFDLIDPGFGTATEVWLSVPSGNERQLAAALDRAPYDQLVVARRSVIENELNGSPLSRFTLGLFAIAGLIAGLLAIAAIHLATGADAAEQAPLHRALAAEGVPPRALSRMVRTAAGAIVVSAVLIGVLGALVLLRTVTRVVSVTATSSVPIPPLVASVPAGNLVLAIVALLLPCLVAAALAARAARRAAHGDLLREFG